MKKLFLSSYFAEVAQLLSDFLGQDCNGKSVAFIPTASNVEKVTFYIGADKKALRSLGMTVHELDIAKEPKDVIERTLKECDYIFVDGGNTFYLLQELKNSGADKIIIDQIKAGKPYIGASAGSMVLSPDISYVEGMDSPKPATSLESFKALNVIDFYPLPHVNNFPFKKAAQKIKEQYGDKLDLCAIDNSQVILVEGTNRRVAGKDNKLTAQR